MSMVEQAPGGDTPIATTPAEPVEQPQQAVEAEQPEGQKPQDRTFSQKDVDEIVRKVRKNESRRAERIARAEARAEFAERQLTERAQTPQAPKGRPQAKDFQTVEEFLDADYTWRREREREAEAKERQSREPQERAQSEAQEFSRSLQERLADGPDKYDDFEEKVFSDDAHFTDPMVARIKESDHPVDLAYYLADHPKELREIGKLSPTNQILRLKEIEDKLSSTGKPTQAPAPITPTGTRAASTGYRPDMTDKEFAAWRRKSRK